MALLQGLREESLPIMLGRRGGRDGQRAWLGEMVGCDADNGTEAGAMHLSADSR